MGKYFTRRAIGLHLLTLVVVPGCLLAGWWQYHVAMSGNSLSWLYTVEWPFFAIYGLFMWWALVHDQRTPFDRLWAAKQRAATDAAGRPLHDIPGWARDKTLYRAAVGASAGAPKIPALSSRREQAALGSYSRPVARQEWIGAKTLDGTARERALRERDAVENRPAGGIGEHAAGPVIDAPLIDVKVVLDEELDEYNRYLADLAWRDPPKRWGSRRSLPGQ
ncbi:MAG: hypothetical protein ACYCST_11775 [Acidimicrobiales bacterium]